MFSRREIIGAAGASIVPFCQKNASSAENLDTFDSLYKDSLLNPKLLIGGNNRENRSFEFETRAIAPRLSKSKRTISEKAIDLIVLFEVTNKDVYEKKYKSPVVPALSSGITIGIGYDLGYVKPEWMYEDWAEIPIDKKILKRLEKVCRLKGDEAQKALSLVKDISINWEIANRQFRERLLPLYTAETENALLNTSSLSADSLGALVSLVYNRGADFKSEEPTRDEMRNIRTYMEKGKPKDIPPEIRAMKRLWQNQPKARGLLRRRDMEALLFQEGLGKKT